ncbi:hypothetical protein SKAU_G00355440 [Synaphobranchus kaupii]|uniref:Uncharacterized protein n=1 Tax=Synaphobranchus kaupii TaxID=118154 RepID=A0A9Q1IEF1_SYNKA|nr:hypothetical protein SKAU_G00355440 [Synaphobranchus kaupii]
MLGDGQDITAACAAVPRPLESRTRCSSITEGTRPNSGPRPKQCHFPYRARGGRPRRRNESLRPGLVPVHAVNSARSVRRRREASLLRLPASRFSKSGFVVRNGGVHGRLERSRAACYLRAPSQKFPSKLSVARIRRRTGSGSMLAVVFLRNREGGGVGEVEYSH